MDDSISPQTPPTLSTAFQDFRNVTPTPPSESFAIFINEISCNVQNPSPFLRVDHLKEFNTGTTAPEQDSPFFFPKCSCQMWMKDLKGNACRVEQVKQLLSKWIFTQQQLLQL